MSIILKKRFGQNFLIDKNISDKICKHIHSKNLNILEIGPGNGNLTDKIILKKPSNLTLIEIDKDLISHLSEKFSHINNIEIINADILKTNLDQNFDLVVSNLPYNISSQILVKLTTLNNIPDTLILMFQKEFASRLLNNKLNSINSLVKCFYKINLDFHVSRNCFRPIPKVDSSVLIFKKKNKSLINFNEINDFIEFKRNLFSHKRKSLKNILKNFEISKDFNQNLRVEDLDIIELVSLFRNINL